MRDENKAVCATHSVKVFGSAVLRVAPDTASIVVAVSRLEQKPETAFSKAREGAQAVNAYLHKSGVKDFGSSRVTLTQEYRYTNGENRFVGYQARIAFNVVLREMDKVDSLLSGLIAAGGNELASVTFQTTRLKDLGADARRRAVAAAREKAELYCKAAGVELGNVLAIPSCCLAEAKVIRTANHLPSMMQVNLAPSILGLFLLVRLSTSFLRLAFPAAHSPRWKCIRHRTRALHLTGPA